MTDYFVYILSNKSRMLYVGVTNNIERRIFEHCNKLVPGFPERYGLTRLVYYESTGGVNSAINREKQIKGWVRRKKVALIHSLNPEWRDLSSDWTPSHPETLRFAQGDSKGAQGDNGCAEDNKSSPYSENRSIPGKSSAQVETPLHQGELI
jgi:putative endonuclease